MTNAIRDNNHKSVLLGILFSDGVTLVPIKLNASSQIQVNISDTISFTPDQDALKDGNYMDVLMAVDSTDASKLCPVYVDSDGKILTDNGV